MKQLLTLCLALIASSAALATPSERTPGACLNGAPSGIQTADYPRQFVPADARMALHLDLKNLRNSHFGKALGEVRKELKLEELDELIAKLGFDPIQELNSVTAYNSSENEENFCAVLVASAVIDVALEKLPEQEGYRSVSKAGIDFFQFDELVGSWHIMENGERVVVVGKTIDVALRGHQVIHGDVPSQASPDAKLSMVLPHRGSILFIAGGGEVLKRARGALGSSVMDSATGGVFELGESEGALQLRLGVSTETREAAQDLREMVGGFLAMGRMLIASNDQVPAELASLLRGVNLIVEGKGISLSLDIPIQAAMGLMRSMER